MIPNNLLVEIGNIFVKESSINSIITIQKLCLLNKSFFPLLLELLEKFYATDVLAKYVRLRRICYMSIPDEMEIQYSNAHLFPPGTKRTHPFDGIKDWVKQYDIRCMSDLKKIGEDSNRHDLNWMQYLYFLQHCSFLSLKAVQHLRWNLKQHGDANVMPAFLLVSKLNNAHWRRMSECRNPRVSNFQEYSNMTDGPFREAHKCYVRLISRLHLFDIRNGFFSKIKYST